MSFTDMCRIPGFAARTAGVVLAVLLLGGCAHLAQSPVESVAQRAETAYEAGDYAAAVRAYTRYLQHRPEDATAWYRLGNAQAQLGELEAAESSLRQALTLNPELARARHNLGLVQIQLGVGAILEARRELPEVDDPAARTMQYLACLMETFMGYPRPQTCEPGFAEGEGAKAE